MRSALFLVVLVAVVSPASAEELKDLRAVEALSKEAATLIGKGEIKEAYAKLAVYWPMPKAEVQALVYQTEAQRPMIATRFGKSLSIERAGTQVLGDSFVRHIFLEKYERHAIVWVFTYYRPGSGWFLNNAQYTDQFDSLFEWSLGRKGAGGAIGRSP